MPDSPSTAHTDSSMAKNVSPYYRIVVFTAAVHQGFVRGCIQHYHLVFIPQP